MCKNLNQKKVKNVQKKYINTFTKILVCGYVHYFFILTKGEIVGTYIVVGVNM